MLPETRYAPSSSCSFCSFRKSCRPRRLLCDPPRRLCGATRGCRQPGTEKPPSAASATGAQERRDRPRPALPVDRHCGHDAETSAPGVEHRRARRPADCRNGRGGAVWKTAGRDARNRGKPITRDRGVARVLAVDRKRRGSVARQGKSRSSPTGGGRPGGRVHRRQRDRQLRDAADGKAIVSVGADRRLL
jgi:hypothetical protein